MEVNLLDLLSSATTALTKNAGQLNQADTYNHDHGDHMAQIFSLITDAVGQKKNEPPSSQLAYAGKVLEQKSTSGSAKLYSKALQVAAQNFKGQKSVNENNVVTLIQSLLGGGNQPKPIKTKASGGDLLGTLLGGLAGGTTTAKKKSTGLDLGTLLSVGSSLLGSTGAGSGVDLSDGIDLGDIVGIGSSLLNASQKSKNQPQSSSAVNVLTSLLSGSALTQTPTRSASGMLVAQSLLQAAGNLLNKKTKTTKGTATRRY